jgi:hypothetical protein
MEEKQIEIEASEEELRQARIQGNQRAIQLLRSWQAEPDDEEQVRALDRLKIALDSHRPDGQKLFP